MTTTHEDPAVEFGPILDKFRGLEPDWQIKIHPDMRTANFDIVGPGGMSLHVVAQFIDPTKPGWDQNKVRISCSWPRDSRREMHKPEVEIPAINVSLSRSPSDLAKDIIRRLIVPYEAAFPAVLNATNRASERYAQREATSRHLAKLIGGRYSEDREAVVGGDIDALYDIQVNGSGTGARIHTNDIPLAKVEIILAILRAK